MVIGTFNVFLRLQALMAEPYDKHNQCIKQGVDMA